MRNAIFSLILFSCFNSALAQTGFVLHGVLTGYEDSTRIIFNKVSGNGTGDMGSDQTVFLVNRQFSFSDNLTDAACYSVRVRPKNIMDEDFTAYENMTLWAENNTMTLTADKGFFAFADVRGSQMHDEYNRYAQLEKEKIIRNKRIVDSIKMFPEGIPAKTLDAMRKTFRENEAAIENARMEFIYNNPQYYFSIVEMAFRVRYYPERMDKKRVVNFYTQINPAYKNDQYGMQIGNYISNTEVIKGLTAGEKAHAFSLPDSTGVVVSLSSLKGKVVLLDFWFAGCAPCRAEHKNYLAVYKEYHQKGFEILSVNIDSKKELGVKAMERDSMIWKAVWDPNQKITEGLYHINAFPSNFLIDEKGIIIAKDIRGEDLVTAIKSVCSKN